VLTRALSALRRYCAYPQEITLRLDVPARVQQIQILSHEYKVRRAATRKRSFSVFVR
jgi:hypothetical protein